MSIRNINLLTSLVLSSWMLVGCDTEEFDSEDLQSESSFDEGANAQDEASAEAIDDDDDDDFALLSEEPLDGDIMIRVYGVAGQPGGAVLVSADEATIDFLTTHEMSSGERYEYLTGKPAPVELRAETDRPRSEFPAIDYGTNELNGCWEPEEWLCWLPSHFCECKRERTTDWSPGGINTAGWYSSKACKIGSSGTVHYKVKRSGSWVLEMDLSANKCASYHQNPTFARTYTTRVLETSGKFTAGFWGQYAF